MSASRLVLVLGLAACNDFEGLSRGHDGGPPPLPVHCSSGVLDEDESDVDCGGACLPCELNQACRSSTDCRTRTCLGAGCGLASGPPGWIHVTDLAPARLGFSLVAGVDGRIYVLGGQQSFLHTVGDPFPVPAVYDAEAGTWEELPAMVPRRAGAGAALGADGRIYFAGGSQSDGKAVTDLDIYDPSTKTWLKGPPMGSARVGFALAPVGAGLIALGGVTSDLIAAMKQDLELLPTLQASWSTQAVPAALQVRDTAALPLENTLFVLGGSAQVGGGVGIAATHTYALGEWHDAPALGTPRTRHGAAIGSDGRVYALGASNVLTVEAYDRQRWTEVAPLPPDYLQPSAARGSDGRLYAMAAGGLGNPLAAYGPVLALSARSIAAGAVLTVQGTNFATRAAVKLSWDDATSAIATGQTDDQGRLSPVSVPVPGTPGRHRLYAEDDRSRYRVSAPCTVE